MKLNMILGKKQIVLSALILALGIAVYLNYQYSSVDSNFELTNALMAEEATDTAGEVSEGEALTEQEDGTEIEVESYGEAYFAEAKLSRSKSRDEAIEALATMLDDADIPAEQKTELALQATAMAESIEIEGKIENLVKAKGFEECMVYYDTEKVDVIVKAEGGLNDQQVAQLQDVILSEVSVPAENIRIVEVK